MGYCKKHKGGEGMISLLPRIPAYQAFRAFGKPALLPFNLTVSLTYNCNSRCKTCNIWKKKANDLSADEYEKIFIQYGKNLFWVTLSGGEPFLRHDLHRIADAIYRHSRPAIINIPTNGLMGEFVARQAESIARTCPKSEIVLNLSLDGIENKHDEIRGIKGNFERAMTAYRHLRNIDLPNFTLGVHTVISRYNVKDVPELCDFVLDKLRPDSYISEVAEERAELDTVGVSITPSAEDYAKAVAYISRRTSGYKSKGLSTFTQAFRANYYRFARNVLRTNSQIIPCYAGIASAQISPEGDVWGCCVRAEPLGNLREHNYDFRKIWFSGKAKRFRKSVKTRECACPLANAYYSSAVCDPSTLMKIARRLI